jgi:hypothetical protein
MKKGKREQTVNLLFRTFRNYLKPENLNNEKFKFLKLILENIKNIDIKQKIIFFYKNIN